MRKIDIHCHATNRKVSSASYDDCSLKQLEREMWSHNVERAVVLASYFPHKSSGISNFRLHNWIRETKKFLLFGSLDFEHYFYQGINELEELAEQKNLAGIKLYTTYQNIDFKSKKFKELVGLARKHRLPIAFHAGHSFAASRKLGRESVTSMIKASDLEFVAAKNPEINVLACHMAKPYTDDLIEVANRNPNFYTDVSGLIDSKTEGDKKSISEAADEARKFIEFCGHRNLLFGTDFPIQTYEHSETIVEDAMKNNTAKEKQDVYYNNARRFLNEIR